MITQEQIKAAADADVSKYVRTEEGKSGSASAGSRLTGFIAGASWMREQDQWIWVKDQQPPLGPDTGCSIDLLFFAEGKTRHGFFIFGLNLFNDGKHHYDAKYWQLLPDGPKNKTP